MEGVLKHRINSLNSMPFSITIISSTIHVTPIRALWDNFNKIFRQCLYSAMEKIFLNHNLKQNKVTIFFDFWVLTKIKQNFKNNPTRALFQIWYYFCENWKVITFQRNIWVKKINNIIIKYSVEFLSHMKFSLSLSHVRPTELSHFKSMWEVKFCNYHVR